jgi:hypothetical protein
MEAALAIQPGLPKSPASGFKGKAAVQVHLPGWSTSSQAGGSPPVGTRACSRQQCATLRSRPQRRATIRVHIPRRAGVTGSPPPAVPSRTAALRDGTHPLAVGPVNPASAKTGQIRPAAPAGARNWDPAGKPVTGQPQRRRPDRRSGRGPRLRRYAQTAAKPRKQDSCRSFSDPPCRYARAFKLIEAAQARWRAVNAPHLVALVRAGATFVDGQLAERPTQTAA